MSLYPAATGLQVADAGGWRGLRIRLRATRPARVLAGTEAVVDFDDFGVGLDAGPEGGEFDVPFARLRQARGGGQAVGFDPARITHVWFSVSLPAGEFQVDVDEIAFVR